MLSGLRSAARKAACCLDESKRRLLCREAPQQRPRRPAQLRGERLVRVPSWSAVLSGELCPVESGPEDRLEGEKGVMGCSSGGKKRGVRDHDLCHVTDSL